jgi:hypothetical protein
MLSRLFKHSSNTRRPATHTLTKTTQAKLALTSLALLSPLAAVQADEINLASFPIPLMVIDQNSGVFVELVKEIDKRIEHSVKLSVYPAKRTVSQFHSEGVDGFFPALDILPSAKKFHALTVSM